MVENPGNEGLDQRNNLKTTLQNALSERGSVSHRLSDLNTSIDSWRKTARAVGRELGRPIRTLVSGDAVHAVLTDWPQGESEQRIFRENLRAAMEGVSQAWSVAANGTSQNRSEDETIKQSNVASDDGLAPQTTLVQLALYHGRPQAELRELLTQSGRTAEPLEGHSIVSTDDKAYLRKALENAEKLENKAWAFEPGDEIRRIEIHRAYGGSRQSGIVTFASIHDIVVFTSLESGAQFGYNKYEGLQEDGSFSYTGQGQTGDQEFTRGNRALRDANREGRPIRLFTVQNSIATYIGCFATGDPTYWIKKIPDSIGGDRNGIIFNLVPVDASSELLMAPDTKYEAPIERPWTPPNTDDIVIRDDGRHRPGDRIVSRVEFELQRDFGLWLQERGTAPARLQLATAGTVIEPDLYVPARGWVIEAKKSTAREYVRTAIGQVLDYAHVARRQGLHCIPVLLLPGWPVRDLIELAQHHRIAVIVREGKGFTQLQVDVDASVTLLRAGQDLPTRVL